MTTPIADILTNLIFNGTSRWLDVGSTSVIPELERLRQEICHRFETTLGYMVSLGEAWVCSETLSHTSK